MVNRHGALVSLVLLGQSILGGGRAAGPNSVADHLQSLLTDPRFGSCNSGPSSPECQSVRDETERAIVDAQNQIDEDVASSQGFMNSTKAELISKVAALKKMNETLMGSMFAPGLVEQYAALNEAIPQMESVLSGAQKSIEDEIQKRGSLYQTEMTRIADAQQKSADSAQKAMLQLSSSNLLAQTAQIKAISNVYGGSLSDLGSQISDLLAQNEQTVGDLNNDVSQAVSNAQAELSVLGESASVAREDAKAVAAAGTATFKNAETSLFKTAQAQLGVYEQYADALLSSAQTDTDQTLKNTIQDLADQIVQLRGTLLEQFQDNTATITKDITSLQDAAGSLVPNALQRSESIVDQANVKVQSAQQSASTSTKSVEKLTADTSSMLQDVISQIKDLKSTQQDIQDQASAQFDESVSKVQDSASGQLSNMASGMSDELDLVRKRVQSTQASASGSIAQAKDSYISQLAGIQADSGQSSLTALNAVRDASEASSTLGKLNSARLNAVTAANQAQLNAVTGTVMGALQDTGDSSQELSSEMGQQNRELEIHAGQMVADSNSEVGKTVRDLKANVAREFADVQNSVLQTQQLSQTEVSDLQAAVGALGQGSAAVGNKASDLQKMLSGMTSQQLQTFGELFNQITTSSNLVSSTSAAATAKLQGAVKGELSSQLAALMGTLEANADGVGSNIKSAQSDALDLAEKLNKSSATLQGNYQRTNSDMAALLATLSGANGNMAASTKNLNTLLSSLTSEQIVQFRKAISKLRADSGTSTGALRAYLQAMIANKTDSAKMDTREVFLSNQAALTEALNDAGDEISKTKDLASKALLDNKIVRDNSTLLLKDFESTESKLADVSTDHANILNEIVTNITNWKASLEQRINAIQAQVASGASQLPEFAEEKLKNISAVISMNQKDLKTFLSQFQDSLDHAKAIQDHFQDSQSARIISALTGVSQAITVASVRMASQVANSDMSANDKARALTEVLSQLCNSIDLSNAQAASSDAAIAAQLRAMGKSVNGSVASLSEQVNGMMNSLATDKLNKDINLATNMETAVTNAGVGINASANAIQLAQDAIHRAVEKSSAGWANNNKNAYTLGGFLFSLSQQSQQKLLYILQQLQTGSLSMDQALALARQADISQIQSAQDVVAVLVGAMDGYDQTVQEVFGTGYERLEAASKDLGSRVGNLTSDLVYLAAELDYNSSLLANRVDRFANISDTFINTSQQNVSDLETYIFNQQAEVTNSLNGLKSLMDYAEKDITLREQQFNNWIDSLITNETAVIAKKTQTLKNKLLGEPPASAPSSFVEKQTNALENVRILKAEMMELDRRRINRRNPQNRQNRQNLRKPKQAGALRAD